MGMRQGEILGLTLPDIDFKENTIDVNKQYLRYTDNGKPRMRIDVLKSNNSYRKIYMTNFVSYILQDYIDNMKIINLNNQHLFINHRTERIISHTTVYYYFTNFLKKKQSKTYCISRSPASPCYHAHK